MCCFFWPWDIRDLNSPNLGSEAAPPTLKAKSKHKVLTTREVHIPTILGPERTLGQTRTQITTVLYNWPSLHLHHGQATGTTSKRSQISTVWVCLSSVNFEYSSDIIWIYQASQTLAKSPQYTDQKDLNTCLYAKRCNQRYNTNFAISLV